MMPIMNMKNVISLTGQTQNWTPQKHGKCAHTKSNNPFTYQQNLINAMQIHNMTDNNRMLTKRTYEIRLSYYQILLRLLTFFEIFPSHTGVNNDLHFCISRQKACDKISHINKQICRHPKFSTSAVVTEKTPAIWVHGLANSQKSKCLYVYVTLRPLKIAWQGWWWHTKVYRVWKIWNIVTKLDRRHAWIVAVSSGTEGWRRRIAGWRRHFQHISQLIFIRIRSTLWRHARQLSAIWHFIHIGQLAWWRRLRWTATTIRCNWPSIRPQR